MSLREVKMSNENYGNVIHEFFKDNKFEVPKKKINNAEILPYNTRSRRVDYSNGVTGIVGEIARHYEEFELSDVNLTEELNQMIKSHKVDVDKSLKDIFAEIIMNFNPKETNQMNKDYRLFKFLPLNTDLSKMTDGKISSKSKELSKNEKKLANFINTIILNQSSKLDSVFNQETRIEDPLTKLYIDLFSSEKNTIEKKDAESYVKYHHLLDKVIDIDLEFMLSKKDFFSENFDKFIAYYYFIYIIQLIYKIDVRTDQTDGYRKIYWLYDSEKASLHREAVNHNWRAIKSNVGKRMYVNSLILKIIVILNNGNFITLSDFYEKDFNSELIQIIDCFEISDEILDKKKKASNTRDYIVLLFSIINKIYSEGKEKQGSQNRYFLWLEDFAKKYFLKIRGRYGYTLNLTEEYLVFLTTIIIKKDRMKLSTLFSEFEKRGLFLDNKSKKEVIKVFDKQGILQKKSDSGDAQYVSQILK